MLRRSNTRYTVNGNKHLQLEGTDEPHHDYYENPGDDDYGGGDDDVDPQHHHHQYQHHGVADYGDNAIQERVKEAKHTASPLGWHGA